MEEVRRGDMPSALGEKIDAFLTALCEFPEYNFSFFKTRIVRRPVGAYKGRVWGSPRDDDKHWYTYIRGGDADEVQLNVGMYPEHVRVGLGFQVGRTVKLKIPAFRVFQSLLSLRPPIPFRSQLVDCIGRNGLGIEIDGYPTRSSPDELVSRLETLVVTGDRPSMFVLLGALWSPQEAEHKSLEDYRRVFQELMPFYEAVLLTSGRLKFIQG
jgi:hypothetical protein